VPGFPGQPLPSPGCTADDSQQAWDRLRDAAREWRRAGPWRNPGRRRRDGVSGRRL